VSEALYPDDPSLPFDRVRHDLTRTASAYRLIAEIPAHCRSLAMRVCVERPYLFERNLRRWPDGKFHLLDRRYQPWSGHEIAHTADDLRDVGLDAWQRSSAVQVDFLESCWPLVDDVLQNFPSSKWRRHLRTLAGMLDNLARRQRP
jgi:hypothetical protein